jgi:hypothetical protein
MSPTERIDAMFESEADALAKRVFGPKAEAHETRRDFRIYLRRDELHLSLLAAGEAWSTVFADAVAAAGVTL